MTPRQREPARLSGVIDGDYAVLDAAPFIDPFTDLLGADLRLAIPGNLLGHAEGEHGVPVMLGGRPEGHRTEATEGLVGELLNRGIAPGPHSGVPHCQQRLLAPARPC